MYITQFHSIRLHVLTLRTIIFHQLFNLNCFLHLIWILKYRRFELSIPKIIVKKCITLNSRICTSCWSQLISMSQIHPNQILIILIMDFTWISSVRFTYCSATINPNYFIIWFIIYLWVSTQFVGGIIVTHLLIEWDRHCLPGLLFS